MGRCLQALIFLSLISCDSDIQRTPTRNEPQEIQLNQSGIDRLNLDIQKWSTDSRLSTREKVEILKSCGYDLRTSSWTWGVGINYIWNGREWQPLTEESIHNFPISGRDMYNLINSYCNTSR